MSLQVSPEDRPVGQFMDLTQPFSFVGFIMQMSIDYSLAPVDSSQTPY